MDNFDNSTYHAWTSCQVHGHQFEDAPTETEPNRRRCTDCGEEYDNS